MKICAETWKFSVCCRILHTEPRGQGAQSGHLELRVPNLPRPHLWALTFSPSPLGMCFALLESPLISPPSLLIRGEFCSSWVSVLWPGGSQDLVSSWLAYPTYRGCLWRLWSLQPDLSAYRLAFRGAKGTSLSQKPFLCQISSSSKEGRSEVS